MFFLGNSELIKAGVSEFELCEDMESVSSEERELEGAESIS